jgi:hypothetical protein
MGITSDRACPQADDRNMRSQGAIAERFEKLPERAVRMVIA